VSRKNDPLTAFAEPAIARTLMMESERGASLASSIHSDLVVDAILKAQQNTILLMATFLG
jgi:hypothetical protein